MLSDPMFRKVSRWIPYKVLFFATYLWSVVLYYNINSMLYDSRSNISNSPTILDIPCKQMVVDLWDEDLKPYLSLAPRVNCPKTYNLFYVDSHGFLQLNASFAHLYNMTSSKCVYYVLTRVNDSDLTVGPAIKFNPPVFVKGHLFCVVCKDGDGASMYRFVHANIRWNKSELREKEIGSESDNNISVIFLGLDSVSRSHALRYLPLSYKYLTRTLSAHDLTGYRRVGLNSFPNIVTLLTGESGDEFYMQKHNLEFMDNMPFLWRESSLKRYATHFSEDYSFYNTFNYNKKGFNKDPFDHYFRPHSMVMKAIAPVLKGSTRKVDESACYGDKEQFHIQIDYFKGFIDKYSGRLRFAFFWNNELSHEEFNTIGRADKPLLQLLQWLKRMGHLDRSMLIIGSDHGYRGGGASTTNVGRSEIDMPFMAVYIPPVLLAQYPRIRDSLVHNTDRLVTPYDIYETMRAVMYGHFSRQDYPNVQRTLVRRSLFEKIPSTRTCADDGIPDRYCRCMDVEAVNVSLPVVGFLATYSVNHINMKLVNYTTLCQQLQLLNVTDAKWIPFPEDKPRVGPLGFHSWYNTKRYNKDSVYNGRYTLLFYTKPNEGLYEAMIDYRFVESGDLSKSVKLIGEPLRLDRYGNEGACIHDINMKQFCVCS